MSKSGISRVSGFVGSGLTGLSLVALILWNINLVSKENSIDLGSSGERTFGLYLFIFMIALLYIGPAIITLAINLISSKKLNAGLVVQRVFLILGGLWFIPLYASAFYTMVGDIGSNVIWVWPYKLAFGIATYMGSTLLIASGILKLAVFFTERPRQPRIGSLPRYSQLIRIFQLTQPGYSD